MRYYVIDTNYLLEHFEQLSTHQESKVIILSVIEQEVFELSQRTSPLQKKAVHLVKQLIAQKKLHVHQRTLLFEEEIAISTKTHATLLDVTDKIMACTMQLQSIYKGNDVVILSTDHHLLLKSWIYAVPIHHQL